MAQYKAPKYNIHVINTSRNEKYSDKLLDYVSGVAQKRGFDNIRFKVIQHKDMNNEIRQNKKLSPKHIAQGYVGSGGEGSWSQTEKKHRKTNKPYMRRSNRVYEHLVEEGAKLYNVCESHEAALQALGLNVINSEKLNAKKEEGLRHKYLVPEDEAKKLGKGNYELSEDEHEGHRYIKYFEKDNISGSQHHPETKQSLEDEQTIVKFLEKVTGQKAKESPLEKKVRKSTKQNNANESETRESVYYEEQAPPPG